MTQNKPSNKKFFKSSSFGAILLLLILAWSCKKIEPEFQELKLGDEYSLAIEKYKAEGNTLLIWLPTELGLKDGEKSISRDLAKSGIEVWHGDMIEAHFLPPVESSIDDVPVENFVTLIDEAIKHGKNIYIMSAARGAVLALRGARAWQKANPGKSDIHGIVLLHPNLYQQPEAPGQDATFAPEVRLTNLPVYILQSELSPWSLRVRSLANALESNHAPVHISFLKGLRDRFYFRPDATPFENQEAKKLSGIIANAIQTLNENKPPEYAIEEKQEQKKDHYKRKSPALRIYSSKTRKRELSLPDINGQSHALKDHLGQVVLINFWASWCPPCIHEMPSMVRLNNLYKGKNFTILAVNIAEDKKTVEKFANEKMKLNFPILLDQNQKYVEQWHVFSYPTSFLIDRKGNIRYGVFGGLIWDDPEVTRVIDRLLKEP